ncbi:hypothetical protein GLOIN_2v1719704 [Rhizophagus irregularis DAOM 181602=DAOM 197198]|uniref:Uncharacterized protein n=2 Tax=Rhizophagus irregularis (strain DAOM 181602 / DAOM 197198 / MUCL 43194) TaxID=747089 RepID=A0A2P4P2Y5_RHIID|nr:hypothetical protein GLOIN_2v1719704 [Rhizophagus irregularis DAOM 181602=DAOM 197198]POG59728.1 hypothetical protein GLOIN_2v1719704 [Rhizophagus irregularis DAOM 181602=DAOM 197198]GET56333.1 hypothetical protein GLOIN_2v1719704 [Rhizophagus irregularis DAOM 181602=DAOM 197198]|eukprot:XP_025166594.1 hypothetical protein GLOIN_2v1719704 [Rhizophagus irregularis DAOM 181602=DAOM 197198]
MIEKGDYSILYKKKNNINHASVDSLKELNPKLLAEIAELREQNAKLRAKLKSITKKKSRYCC